MEGKRISHSGWGTVYGSDTFCPEVVYRCGSAVAKLFVTVLIFCGVTQANSQRTTPTYTVDASWSTAAIQAVLNSASPGEEIYFTAGRYSVTAPMYLPCGVTLTGPRVSPATAELFASFNHSAILNISGCVIPMTIDYLRFANTGGIYVTAPSARLTVAHNNFVALPADNSQTSDMGIYVDGTHGGTISDAIITDNTFGDTSSCNAVMSANQDMGGLCTGVLFEGDIDGVLMMNNIFSHLEEGFHILCYGNLCRGSGSPSLNNFTAQWNDFNNIHRIAVEIQPENATNVTIRYNSYETPFLPSTFTMGISAACCGGLSGVTAPLINDNVLLANAEPAGAYIAYALEWWGNGAQADDNLIQGNWAHGVVWGKGGGPWEIRRNVVEGPYMGGNYGCYICDEGEGAATTPVQAGDNTSLVVTPVRSVMPIILVDSEDSPASAIVTLRESGSNHSIYYTLDGSTPTTASTRYGAPFTVSPGTTVKAIGMWGQGANPLSYPAGYGYIPSAVATRQIGELSPVLVSAYLASKGNIKSIQRGRTLQFVAHGVYSDGSSRILPDADGNAVTAWNTSNHAVAKISTKGHVTAIGVGTVAVRGMIGNLRATATSVTITEAADALSTELEGSTDSGGVVP